MGLGFPPCSPSGFLCPPRPCQLDFMPCHVQTLHFSDRCWPRPPCQEAPQQHLHRHHPGLGFIITSSDLFPSQLRPLARARCPGPVRMLRPSVFLSGLRSSSPALPAFQPEPLRPTLQRLARSPRQTRDRVFNSWVSDRSSSLGLKFEQCR